MKIKYGQLKSAIRLMMNESSQDDNDDDFIARAQKHLDNLRKHNADASATLKKDKKSQVHSPFKCPRHKLPLEAVWRHLEVPVEPDRDPSMRTDKNILKPTSVRGTDNQKKEKIKIIQKWRCPLWSDTGPYAYSEKHERGHACDYEVSAKLTRPGQTFKHEARGEVAEEEGMLHTKLFPTQVKQQTPPALLDVIEKMDKEGFRWKKQETEKGSPPELKKVREKQKKKFTGDDVYFLSYVYPKALRSEKDSTEVGEDYEGSDPYYYSGDKVIRLLLKLGWDFEAPEKQKDKKYDDKTSSSDKLKTIIKRRAKDTAITSKVSDAEEEESWLDTEDENDDDPWDEDTDHNESDDDDDENIPARWKL